MRFGVGSRPVQRVKAGSAGFQGHMRVPLQLHEGLDAGQRRGHRSNATKAARCMFLATDGEGKEAPKSSE